MSFDKSDRVELSRSEHDALLRAKGERDALLNAGLCDLDDLKLRLAEQLRLNWRDAGYPPELADKILAGEAPLKVLREARGLSVQGLSQMTGVNRTRIIELEAGKTNNTISYLQKLARYFGVAVDDILNR